MEHRAAGALAGGAAGGPLGAAAVGGALGAKAIWDYGVLEAEVAAAETAAVASSVTAYKALMALKAAQLGLAAARAKIGDLLKTAVEELCKALAGHKMIVLYFKVPSLDENTLDALKNSKLEDLLANLPGDLLRSFRGIRGYVSAGNKSNLLKALPKWVKSKIPSGHFYPHQLQDTEKLAIADAIADQLSTTTDYDYNLQVMISLGPLDSCPTCIKTLSNYVANYGGNVIYIPPGLPAPGVKRLDDKHWKNVERVGQTNARTGRRLALVGAMTNE